MPFFMSPFKMVLLVGSLYLCKKMQRETFARCLPDKKTHGIAIEKLRSVMFPVISGRILFGPPFEQ